MPDTSEKVSAAEFVQARTAIEDGDFKVVILDFQVIDVEPAGVLRFASSTDDAQKLLPGAFAPCTGRRHRRCRCQCRSGRHWAGDGRS